MKTIQKACVLPSQRDILIQAVLRIHAVDHLHRIAPDGGADADVAPDVHGARRHATAPHWSSPYWEGESTRLPMARGGDPRHTRGTNGQGGCSTSVDRGNHRRA
eukprot:14624253-Heterocapsa_arctica.AAC.1